MATALIAAHVVAAILLLGPITVAGSRFPRAVRDAARAGTEEEQQSALGSALELHRITRGYAPVSGVVPVLGLMVAGYLEMFGQRWLQVSIALTVVAAVVLGGWVVPGQARVLREPPDERAVVRVAAATGLFGMLWVAIAVLMVVRPGLGS